jgi:hypothetical protein
MSPTRSHLSAPCTAVAWSRAFVARNFLVAIAFLVTLSGTLPGQASIACNDLFRTAPTFDVSPWQLAGLPVIESSVGGLTSLYFVARDGENFFKLVYATVDARGAQNSQTQEIRVFGRHITDISRGWAVLQPGWKPEEVIFLRIIADTKDRIAVYSPKRSLRYLKFLNTPEDFKEFKGPHRPQFIGYLNRAGLVREVAWHQFVDEAADAEFEILSVYKGLQTKGAKGPDITVSSDHRRVILKRSDTLMHFFGYNPVPSSPPRHPLRDMRSIGLASANYLSHIAELRGTFGHWHSYLPNYDRDSIFHFYSRGDEKAIGFSAVVVTNDEVPFQVKKIVRLDVSPELFEFLNQHKSAAKDLRNAIIAYIDWTLEP